MRYGKKRGGIPRPSRCMCLVLAVLFCVLCALVRNRFLAHRHLDDEVTANGTSSSSTEDSNNNSQSGNPQQQQQQQQLVPPRDEASGLPLRDAGKSRTPQGHASKERIDKHLLVIWHDALPKYKEILTDIAKQFLIYEIGYFDWPKESPPKGTPMEDDPFLMNLWRLYNGKGGWNKEHMKLKVSQCGRGPFIAVVVGDEDPVYLTEKTAHGDDVVNHRMNEVKKKYRKWSGGGFRVHGTFNKEEAAHDIALLFHRSVDTFQVPMNNMQSQDEMIANILARWSTKKEHNKLYTNRWTMGWKGEGPNEWATASRLKSALQTPYQQRLVIGCGEEMRPVDDRQWCGGEDEILRIVAPKDVPLMAVAALLNGKRLNSDTEVEMQTARGAQRVQLLHES